MDAVMIFAIAACLLSAGVVYVVLQVRHFGASQVVAGKLLTAETELAVTQKKLLGYTKYADCFDAGKLALVEQLKPPVAKVVREYVHVAQVPKGLFNLNADATVVVTYSVEFNFGLDVAPERLDLTHAANGIGLKIFPPMLVGEPQVKHLSHKMVSTANVPNENAVLADIHLKFAVLAGRYGAAMSTEAPLRALCKLKALECLRDALAKQSGVRQVPSIFVDFK